MTFAVNTFLTERIEETITGYAAPFVVESLRLVDSICWIAMPWRSPPRWHGVPGARDVQIQAPPGTPQLIGAPAPRARGGAGPAAADRA